LTGPELSPHNEGMVIRKVNSDLQLPQFRVTLNSRCGRACFFCRPSGEAVATHANQELDVDELMAVAQTVRRFGIRDVKLTGGDPALYSPLEEAVYRLRNEAKYEEIELISRHPLIGPRAERLAVAGVTKFNISIDTLEPSLHHELCGVNDLPGVLDALDACLATGRPCKVNTVVMAGINDGEIPNLIAFCARRGVRTLKLLDVIKDLDEGTESFARRLAIKRGTQLRNLYQPLSIVADKLRATAVSESTSTQGGLGHPMTSLVMPGGLEVLLKDSNNGAWYATMCRSCAFFPCHDALMALRLTSDLRLQFCLLREDVTVSLADKIGHPDVLEATVREALAVYAGAAFVETSHDLGVLQA
jgi:cyclic pyranopterin phosphate synthase